MKTRVVALLLALALIPLLALSGPALFAGAIPSNQGANSFYSQATLQTANVITVTEVSGSFTGWAPASLIGFTISCTEDSGTATLDAVLQKSFDNGTTWSTVIAMTQLAATGAETKLYADVRASTAQMIGDLLRISWTVGGTGQYTCSAYLAGEG